MTDQRLVTPSTAPAQPSGAPVRGSQAPAAESWPPAQAQSPAPAGEPSAPVETQGVDAPGTAAAPMPAWGWAGIAVAAALLAAAAVAALRRRKRKPVRPPIGGDGCPRPPLQPEYEVEKLHEQGGRKSQQDSFYVSPVDAQGRLLAVVADGMGGLDQGDKVSQAAVTAIANGFYAAQGRGQELLLGLLAQANRSVNALLGPDGLCSGGSTLVAGLFQDGAFHCLSVGDSRICLLRDRVVYQLNREHIYRNELCVDAANGLCAVGDASAHPKSGGLTSFLGMGQLKYVDLPAQPIAVQAGDVFALMSDGVYNALTPEELRDALMMVHPADALRAAIQAKNYANQDNYTAVVIRCNYIARLEPDSTPFDHKEAE